MPWPLSTSRLVRSASGDGGGTSNASVVVPVDWERFFEDPAEGVIPLVLQARSKSVLRKIYAMVVAQLFRRAGDESRRQTFSALLDELMVDEVGLDIVKQRLCVVFRHIKEDRKARVRMLEEGLQDGERRVEIAIPEPEPDPPPPADPDPVPVSADEPSARQAFKDVFASLVRQRLDAIQADSNWCRRNRITPPFLVSTVFAGHWESILRDHFGDSMADHFPGLLKRIKAHPPGERHAFTRAALEEFKYRKVVWETWQGVWTDLTNPRPKPAKPDSRKQKKGLLAGLGGGKPNKSRMTMQQWRDALGKVASHNERTARIWEDLLAEHDDYLPPLREDGPLLMQMFGRSAKGLTKEMEAVRQIVAQGGSYGRVFDAYQAKRQLDIALVAVSYRYPGLFLDREKGTLATLLAGAREKQRAALYPLVTRYLSDYLGRPPADDDPVAL